MVKETDFIPSPHPQKIGVPTLRKLNEWKEYLISEREKIHQKRKEIDEKIDKFLKEVEPLKEYRVIYGNAEGYENTGTFIKNGIEYTYHIDRKNGHISQKIEIHYKVNKTIESFLKLADNKFTQTKE